MFIWAVQLREDGLVLRWSKDKQALRRFIARLQRFSGGHDRPGWLYDIRRHKLTRRQAYERCVWDVKRPARK